MKFDNPKNHNIFVVLILFVIFSLIITSVFLSNFLRGNVNKHEIKLESTKISELNTDAIIDSIITVTGAKSDNVLAQNLDYYFRLTKDFKWDSMNNFDIFISTNKLGKEPYIYYRFDIHPETKSIELFELGEQKEAEPHISLKHLLDALKYIPSDKISNLLDEPDHILIELKRSAPDDENPCIYYDQFGLTEDNYWIIRLDIYPMYYKEQGGSQGTGENMIHLLYVVK